MTKILQKTEGRELIKPFSDALMRIHSNALIKLNNVMDTCGQPLNSRSKPTLFHDFIVHEAKVHFSELENITITEKYNSIILVITKNDCRLAGRFKKFNKKGMPSNINTSRNNNIVSQQYEIEFAELQSPTFVDIGYSINESWTEFNSVKVVCRVNKNLKWELNLSASNNNVHRTIITNPETAIEIAKTKRITAKKEVAR